VCKFFGGLDGTVISATVIDKHRQCVSHTVGHTARERWDEGKRQRKGNMQKKKGEKKGQTPAEHLFSRLLRVPRISCGSSW